VCVGEGRGGAKSNTTSYLERRSIFLLHTYKFITLQSLFSFRIEPFTFSDRPPVILHGRLGKNLVINCSTDDEAAAVSLLQSSTPPFLSFTERRPAAYKVLKRGQVFVILNLQINDAGRYSCVSTNKANQTIQWPPGAGFFVIILGKLKKEILKRI